MSSLPPVPTGSASPRRVRRGPFGKISRLFRTWWSHKVSFAISLILTASALLIYAFTFISDFTPPLLEFIQRLELSALDTRFRYRGKSHTHVDPRIVIVDIDQRSQEVLGRWPFSRTHFPHVLAAFPDDAPTLLPFHITFTNP